MCKSRAKKCFTHILIAEEAPSEQVIEEVRLNVIGEDEIPSSQNSSAASVVTNGEVVPTVVFT
jgi:hypothetical protein